MLGVSESNAFFERYDLSEVGRWKMNQRLSHVGLKEFPSFDNKITKEDRVLHFKDIVANH